MKDIMENGLSDHDIWGDNTSDADDAHFDSLRVMMDHADSPMAKARLAMMLRCIHDDYSNTITMPLVRRLADAVHASIGRGEYYIAADYAIDEYTTNRSIFDNVCIDANMVMAVFDMCYLLQTALEGEKKGGPHTLRNALGWSPITTNERIAMKQNMVDMMMRVIHEPDFLDSVPVEFMANCLLMGIGDSVSDDAAALKGMLG